MEHRYEGYVYEMKKCKIGEEAETWYEFFEIPTGNRNPYHSQEDLVRRLMSELERAEYVVVFHAIDTFRRVSTSKPIDGEIRSRSPSLRIHKDTTFLTGESKLLASLQEMTMRALSARAQKAPAQSA